MEDMRLQRLSNQILARAYITNNNTKQLGTNCDIFAIENNMLGFLKGG